MQKKTIFLLALLAALLAPSPLTTQSQTTDEAVRQRIEQLETEAQSLPDDPYILSQLEKLYAAAGMLEKSKQILESMVKLRPDDPTIYSELGYVLDALKQHDAALKNHLKAVKLGPDDPIAHINLALSYYYVNRAGDAAAEFNNAIDINKRLLDAARQQHAFTPEEITSNINEQVYYLSNIALCYLFTNRPYKALEYLETARGFAPEDPNISALLDKTRASIEKTAATGAVTDEQQLAMHTARDLISRNDPARALEIYRELSAAGVDSVELHINAGKSAFMLGQLDESVSNYKRAAELDPENPVIFFNLGVIYIRQGNEDAAFKALGKAVEFNPDYVTALTVLGPIEARRKMFDAAEKHLTRAIQLDPRQQQPRDELCSMYLQAPRYKQAETLAREWLKDFPDSTGAPLCLATALNLAGESQRARTILERALTMNPSNEKLAALYHSIPEIELPPEIVGMPPFPQPKQKSGKPAGSKKQTPAKPKKAPVKVAKAPAKPKVQSKPHPAAKKPTAVAKAKPSKAKPAATAKAQKPAKAKPAATATATVAVAQPASSTLPLAATATTSASPTVVASAYPKAVPKQKPPAKKTSQAKPKKVAVAKAKPAKPVKAKPAATAKAQKPAKAKPAASATATVAVAQLATSTLPLVATATTSASSTVVASTAPKAAAKQKPPAKKTSQVKPKKAAVAKAKPAKPSKTKPAATAKAQKPAKAKPAVTATTTVAVAQPATSTLPLDATAPTPAKTRVAAVKKPVKPAKKQLAGKTTSPAKPAKATAQKPLKSTPAKQATASKPAKQVPTQAHIDHPSVPLPDAASASVNIPQPSRVSVADQTKPRQDSEIGVEPATGLYKAPSTRLAAIISPGAEAKKLITIARAKKVPATRTKAKSASLPSNSKISSAPPAAVSKRTPAKKKLQPAQTPAAATATVQTPPATATVALVTKLPDEGNVTAKGKPGKREKPVSAAVKKKKTSRTTAQAKAPREKKKPAKPEMLKEAPAVASAPANPSTATTIITEKQAGGGVVFKRVPSAQTATSTVAVSQQQKPASSAVATANKPGAVISVTPIEDKPKKAIKKATAKKQKPAVVTSATQKKPVAMKPAMPTGPLPVLPELSDSIKDQIEAAGIITPPGITGIDPKQLVKMRAELSGKLIYVDRDGTIWARKAGGLEFRRLATGLQPSLTADRRTIVFTTREGATRMVKAMDLASLAAKVLLDDKKFLHGPESAFFKQPAISTDGKHLSVLVESGGGIFDLVLRRLDNGTIMRPLPGYSVENYAWDPSGDRIYFYSSTCGKDSAGRTSCIGLLTVSTGDVKWLDTVLTTSSGKRVYIGNISEPEFSVSPSGKQLLIYDKDMYNASAILIDFASGNAMKLAPAGLDGNEIDFEAIAWAPAGNRFAFINSNYLWVMDSDGKNAFPVQPMPGGVIPPFYWLP